MTTLLRQAAALESRGRTDLAVQTWQRTLLANPDQPDALLGLARDAKRKGNTAEVEKLLARVRSIAPGRSDIDEVESMRVLAGKEERLAEAQRLSSSQQYEQSMQIYREVIGPVASPGGVASSYYETEAATPGGWPRAVAGLRQLVARFPHASGYTLSLGRLLTYRPETRIEGVELLRNVSGDAEATRMARAAGRQALVWEGASTRAVPSLEAYLAAGPDPELQEILREAKTIRTARADTAGAAEGRGYTALDENRLDDAEKAFQEVLRSNSESAAAFAGLGFVRMKQQRFSNAEEYLKRSLELAPGDQVVEEALTTSQFWLAMDAGKTALGQDDAKAAAEHYEAALKLQPGDIDAVAGLAGALMAQGRAAEAAPLFERVVSARADDLGAWKALLRTIYDSDGAVATLERHKRIPEAVALQLEDDPAHLILMASVYSKTNRTAQFDLAFQKVLRMTPNEAGAMSPVRLQFAGLLNQMGRKLEAAAEYERTVESNPENIDAWEGLLAALMSENNGRAMAVLSRMPRDVYEKALERPSFLFNVGLMHRVAGRYDEAAVFLRTALGMGDKLSRERLIATKLQLAYIHRERFNWAEAERSLRNMASEYPQEGEVWKGLVSSLHEQGRDQEARAEADRIPATVITRLYNDPEYVALMASVHNALGNYAEGLRMVQDAIAIYNVDKQTVPAELELQLCWLMLNSEAYPHELLGQMQAASARQDLTEKQAKEVSELWSVWSLREAKAATDAGDHGRATSILKAAVKLFPGDQRLYAALAGSFLDAGDPQQALLVYRSWDLSGANAQDYAGAIGAAMAMKDQRSTSRWLRQALTAWPADADILTLAGREAAARGDYRKAEKFWQLAMEALPATNELQDQLVGSSGAQSETNDLARLLAGVVGGREDDSADLPLPVGQGAGMSGRSDIADGRRASSSLSDALGSALRGGPAAAPIRPNQLVAERAPRLSAYDAAPATFRGRTATPATAEIAAMAFDPKLAYAPIQQEPRSKRNDLEDQIAALHSRNSPFTGVQPRLRSRSGRSGFETLSEQQLNFETSTVFRDKFRVAAIARPTFLDAGDGNGNTELRLGLAPTGSNLGANTASGIGAEVQVSTENFGLKVGSTPDGFLVRNATLGLRLRPANGPFTLMFDRDVVKDTLLSYAGVKDPISGQVFGGVLSNALSLQGDWAGSDSGVYLRGGYQQLTGEQVQTNRRIDGGGGAWWRVMDTPDGALTLGVNLFGMKYDKNLRYFTLGHGGYFSPQRYMLFNVPLTWEGVYNGRFDYSITGSLGIQHIMEDDAPYFPLDAALQGRKGPVYAGGVQTGEHFSLRMEGGYRVAPHWTMGGFVSINNTRSYTNQEAGFYLRYVFREQPLVRDMSVPSLPDWTGGRQIGLP